MKDHLDNGFIGYTQCWNCTPTQEKESDENSN